MNLETMTNMSLWCLPSSITFEKTDIPYLKDKAVAVLETFGKTSVFLGIIQNISGKGRGVIAMRDIRRDEIVAIYPGRLITQA
jgi:hypothetical protein